MQNAELLILFYTILKVKIFGVFYGKRQFNFKQNI